MNEPEEPAAPEIEIIDRQEDENGDYSFTFIMSWPS
jgi:hypothetical protein